MRASGNLQVATGHGPLVGFGNMVDKEYGSWWRTRRALVHLVVWLVVVNGFLLLIGLDEMHSSNPYDLLDELIEIFFRVGGLFTTIGIVVATQSTLLGERQMGTAEWVLSKPVTRQAFVLSKLLVNGASFVALAVAVPAIAFFLQTLWHIHLQPALLPFMAGLLLYLEHLIFYLAFALALGAFLNSRGAVSGAAIGFLFAGLIVPNFWPSSMAWLPWNLTGLGYGVAVGRGLPAGAWQPILISGLWIVLLVLVALWRFDREEF